MCGALVSLAKQWRTPLAIGACAAAAADAVLTSIQAARYNARRARGLRDVFIIAAAIAAPAAAAVILVGGLAARRHHGTR
jgi:hypothetical protein